MRLAKEAQIPENVPANAGWTGGQPMLELIVVVEEAAEGGYTAHGLNAPIFTEADTLVELHDQVRDAVRCHFEPGQALAVVRLHFVWDEVIAV
jgi:hypothetical protein